MSNIALGLDLMGFGLAGVFTALILFYFSIKILTKLALRKKKPKEQ